MKVLLLKPDLIQRLQRLNEIPDTTELVKRTNCNTKMQKLKIRYQMLLT